MSNREQAKTEFEEGSGNVFADLGLEDANERFARAQLGFHVYKILEDRKLKQREIASLLGIKTTGSVPSDERPFQPLHDRQAPRLSQSP